MNLKEVQRVAKSIQNRIFKNSHSYSSGLIKSHFKGSGLQFREHQVYVPGDDVRFIDWKLSARTPNVYIKTFEEERNVEIYIILDITSGMFNGDHGVSKLQAAIETIALLYVLAEKTSDLIHVRIIGLKDTLIPPKRGQEGLVLFISVLEKLNIFQSNGKINFQIQEDLIEITPEERINILKRSMGRKREIVYLGNLEEIKIDSEVKKIFTNRNYHVFKFISDLDLSKKSHFYLKIKTGAISHWTDLKTSFPDEILKLPRVKAVNVSQKYLEIFVREMI